MNSTRGVGSVRRRGSRGRNTQNAASNIATRGIGRGGSCVRGGRGIGPDNMPARSRGRGRGGGRNFL